MGLAVWVGPNSTGDEFRLLDLDVQRASNSMQASWRTAATAATLPNGQGRVVVVASPCLAPAIPVRDIALAATATYEFEPDGALEKVEAASPEAGVMGSSDLRVVT